MFVCLSVSLLAYFRNHMFKLHEIFCACYLWSWLGPSLTTMQYVMHFRFCGCLPLPANLSPLAAANALVRRARCGGTTHCSPPQRPRWTSAYGAEIGDGAKSAVAECLVLKVQ